MKTTSRPSVCWTVPKVPNSFGYCLSLWGHGGHWRLYHSSVTQPMRRWPSAYHRSPAHLVFVYTEHAESKQEAVNRGLIMLRGSVKELFTQHVLPQVRQICNSAPNMKPYQSNFWKVKKIRSWFICCFCTEKAKQENIQHWDRRSVENLGVMLLGNFASGHAARDERLPEDKNSSDVQ